MRSLFVFNIVTGLTEKDEWLLARFFEPFRSGSLKGVAIKEEELKEACRT